MSANRGLRAISLYEAAKGALVLLAGVGALNLLHRDLEDLAERIVRVFRLNPSARFPQIFIDLAGNVTDRQLWGFAIGALLYSAFRFIEAYGLWKERTWAEWLAVVSGSLYLPLEVVALIRHVTALRASLFILNLFVVVYVIVTMMRSRSGSDGDGKPPPRDIPV